MVHACTNPIPIYGSPEWVSLPDGSLAKVAAVVRAAEAWATEGDDIGGRLAVELDIARHAHKAAEDLDYAARRDAHRESWNPRGAFRHGPRDDDEIEAEWLEWIGAPR